MAGMAPGATAYSLTARVLHWLTATLVLTMIPAGIVMVNIGSGALQDFLFNLHRSLGVALIPVILLRLAYRLINPPPRLPGDIPLVQQFAAGCVHWGSLRAADCAAGPGLVWDLRVSRAHYCVRFV